MATAEWIASAAHVVKAPNGRDDSALLHMPADPGERDLLWHAAKYARDRVPDLLDMLGLAEIPTARKGWCTCPLKEDQ